MYWAACPLHVQPCGEGAAVLFNPFLPGTEYPHRLTEVLWALDPPLSTIMEATLGGPWPGLTSLCPMTMNHHSSLTQQKFHFQKIPILRLREQVHKMTGF